MDSTSRSTAFVTPASLMLASGVDLKVTSDLLGHYTIEITADLYTHVAEKLHRDAAQKLDTLLRRK
jgi:integrase